jgi:uncharacterized protein YhaN
MQKRPACPAIHIAFAALLIMLGGCDTAYYKTMEHLGHHKRDIMVDRVESARDAQEEAKEQFESALEKFSSVVTVQNGDLKQQYDQLKAEYDKSQARAQAVSDRVDAVEEVSEDLFAEWEKELAEYSSAKLRRSSEQKLLQTRRQYDQLIRAMRRAEQKMDPVLTAFKDQVLFLKHNLNAQAIASLQNELSSIESDVALLIREMEASIREADTFISAMASEG